MEYESQKQPWALILIAALSLALAAVALYVAFDAKSASDDAAGQVSVEVVQTELSNLVDRLGIAEETLKGEQQAALGKAKNAVRHSESTTVNLSNRIDRLERRIAKLSVSARRTASYAQDIGALEGEIKTLSAEVASLNQRVTKLSKRFNSATAGAGRSGGATAP